MLPECHRVNISSPSQSGEAKAGKDESKAAERNGRKTLKIKMIELELNILFILFRG